MSIERAEAFVMRKVNFKNSDYVVNLFGRDTGKFAGIAKGARKLDSKFGGSFDLLNLLEIVFYQGSGLKFISETDVVENWDGLRSSGEAIDVGLRCARTLNKLLEEGQREEKVFDLFKNTLASLNESTNRPRVLELGFLLKLFRELGYSPQLVNCGDCGREVGSGARFVPRAGGVMCSGCSSDEGIPLSEGLRKILVKLISLPQDQVNRLKVTGHQLEEGFSLLKKFGRYHFDQDVISGVRQGSGKGNF